MTACSGGDDGGCCSRSGGVGVGGGEEVVRRRGSGRGYRGGLGAQSGQFARKTIDLGGYLIPQHL